MFKLKEKPFRGTHTLANLANLASVKGHWLEEVFNG